MLRARLADAKFFYDQDRKTRLEERVSQLAQVVYHNRLGTQLERVERVERLTLPISAALGIDVKPPARAARLCKADLLTGMVGEFPELQGIMGRYYALHDGEPAAVADAIEEHYRPRFAGDALPESTEGCVVALADKLESLAGLFGIGQQPSGDKDPFGLRRQALGVIRILAERKLPLALSQLIEAAFGVFQESFEAAAGKSQVSNAPAVQRKPNDSTADAQLLDFFFDRMRGYFAEAGYSAAEIDAVLALRPDRIDLVPLQLEAVKMFNTLPEAPASRRPTSASATFSGRRRGFLRVRRGACWSSSPSSALAAQFAAAAQSRPSALRGAGLSSAC